MRAAAALFARDGYGGTRTARIAEAAGVSEGTLFHHFPTKRALLAEVGAREGERVLAIAFEDADPASPPPDVEALLRRLFDYAQSAPETYRLFALDGDVEDLSSGFAAKRTRVTRGLSAMLAAWSARGFVRRMDPDVVAELAFGLLDAAVRRLVFEDRWDELDTWLRETTRALERLLFDDEPQARPARTKGTP